MAIKKAKGKAKNVGQRVKCFCVKCFKRLAALAKSRAQKAQDTSQSPDPIIKLPTHHKFHPGMSGGEPQSHHVFHHKEFLGRVAHIIGPIIIGVAFGAMASVLGMAVGQLAICMWRRLRKQEHVVYEPVCTDEKDGLPAYEDIPAALAVSEKEIEAKA